MITTANFSGYTVYDAFSITLKILDVQGIANFWVIVMF